MLQVGFFFVQKMLRKFEEKFALEIFLFLLRGSVGKRLLWLLYTSDPIIYHIIHGLRWVSGSVVVVNIAGTAAYRGCLFEIAYLGEEEAGERSGGGGYRGWPFAPRTHPHTAAIRYLDHRSRLVFITVQPPTQLHLINHVMVFRRPSILCLLWQEAVYISYV